MILSKLKGIAHIIGLLGLILLAGQGAIAVFNGQSVLAAPALQWGNSTIPLVVNYQGYLRDPEGNPLSGSYDVTFKIYDDVVAGTALHTETQTGVTVRNGYFSVLLGNAPGQALPSDLFDSPDSPDRFIGITVAPYEEMIPRQRFAAVAYAFQASNADNLDGRDSSTFADEQYEYSLRADDGSPSRAVYVNNDGHVGIGTTSPRDLLEVRGTLRLASTVNSTSVGYFYHANKGGLIINSDTGGPSSDITFQTRGTPKMFIERGGNVGIGTTDPSFKLSVAGDINWSGDLKGFSNRRYSIERFNDGGTSSKNMTSVNNSFCVLSKVAMKNNEDNDELATCRVIPYDSVWRLDAILETTGDTDVYCEARCLEW